MVGTLFRSIGDTISRIRREREIEDTKLAKESGMKVAELRNIENGVPPNEEQIQSISRALSLPPESLQLASGEIPREISDAILAHPDRALSALQNEFEIDLQQGRTNQQNSTEPILQTDTGTLYHDDCRDVLPTLEKESFDCIFADPPFNLGKDYGENGDDDLPEEQYLEWCTDWIDASIDLLKPGGAFFLYNIPKWNIHLSHHLSRRLNFKHWIAVDIKFRLPIPNRLYPSHYSLLYFIKGKKPNHFEPPRLPVDTCPHCGGEQNDYGGYKNELNSEGLNLTDVWDDIPPVRHQKYKNRDGNELSTKLLHRVIEMATEEGDTVLDPFGGAGTTYAVCEVMGREWTGIELNSCAAIRERLQDLTEDREQIRDYQKHQNQLFTKNALELRTEYRDIFNFNFEDYDLEESPTESVQQTFESL